MIEPHHRVLALGPTQSFKSELLNVHASALACQWALVDPKDEFAIGDVEPVRDVDQLDWQHAPVLHWVAPIGDVEQWEAFFARAFELPGGRFTAVVHEVGASCDYNANKVGRWHNTYVGQGEARELGYWAATTRPVCLPAIAVSECAHAFCSVQTMTRDDDHRRLADVMNLHQRELRDAQTHALPQTGDKGFIYSQRRAGAIQTFDPLPEAARAANIVRRRTTPATMEPDP